MKKIFFVPKDSPKVSKVVELVDLTDVNNRAALARVARIVLGAEPGAKTLDALEQAGARAFFEARP